MIPDRTSAVLVSGVSFNCSAALSVEIRWILGPPSEAGHRLVVHVRPGRSCCTPGRGACMCRGWSRWAGPCRTQTTIRERKVMAQ